jgi:hypothetical protein
MADVVLQYVGTGGVDMSIKSVSEYDSLDCGTEDVPPDPPSFAVVEREKERENEREKERENEREKERENEREKEYLLCALSCFFPIRHYDHHPKSDDGVRRKAQGNTDVLRLQHDVNNTARLFSHASCGVRDGWDLRKVSKAVKMILNAVGLDMVSVNKRVQVKGKRTVGGEELPPVP